MQNNKTHLVLITSALVTMLIISATCASTVYAQNKFRAKLDADNEVPSVDSQAKGHATFKIKADTIKSKINITGISDVSGAQIFMGKIGQNTDPIVDLLKTGEKSIWTGGVSIKGNFTASDLGGSMNGKDLSALQSAMAANQTFVNIMTTEHPNGELAGHIYSKGSTTGAQLETSNSGPSDVTSSQDGVQPENDNPEEEDDLAP